MSEVIESSDVRAQYLAAKDEIDAAMSEVVSSGSFVKGKYVKQFEEQFAEYCGAEHCVGVANGTDAIEIVLEACDIRCHGVIIPVNTAPATACAVESGNNYPRFYDCGDDFTISTSRMDGTLYESATTIVPVHLYGNPCDMDTIVRFAHVFHDEMLIVEDCAQAHGLEINLGLTRHAATYSFYPSKNLGAFGDAGAIVTNDATIADACRAIADLGRTGKYDHTVHRGRNSRLDEIQAAVLCAKLPYLDEWTQRRRRIARMYSDQLGYTYYPNSVYHQFPILVNDRDTVRTELRERGIHTGIHYPTVIPMQPAFDGTVSHGRSADEDAAKKYPVAYSYADRLVSLPIGIHLTDDDVMTVIEAVKELA